MKTALGDSSPQSILSCNEFLSLLKARRRISLVLSFIMMGSYFFFVLILALRKSLFAPNVFGNVPRGIFFGVGLIVLAWILTGIYIYWANTSYDLQVNELKGRLRKGK